MIAKPSQQRFHMPAIYTISLQHLRSSGILKRIACDFFKRDICLTKVFGQFFPFEDFGFAFAVKSLRNTLGPRLFSPDVARTVSVPNPPDAGAREFLVHAALSATLLARCLSYG